MKEKLGVVEMERFIMPINREKFDYTKWRKDLFENMDITDLADKADNKISQITGLSAKEINNILAKI